MGVGPGRQPGALRQGAKILGIVQADVAVRQDVVAPAHQLPELPVPGIQVREPLPADDQGVLPPGGVLLRKGEGRDVPTVHIVHRAQGGGMAQLDQAAADCRPARAVFVRELPDDPVPAEAGMVQVAVSERMRAGLLVEAPGAFEDQGAGKEQGNGTALRVLLHILQRVAGGAAGGVLHRFVPDQQGTGAHQLLQAVEEQVPFIMDAFVEDVQVPVSGAGGGVQHNGPGGDLPGEGNGDAVLPGALLLLDQQDAVPEQQAAADPVLAVEVQLQDGQAEPVREHPRGPAFGVPHLRQAVLPDPVRAGLHFVRPEHGDQVPVQFPETALRAVLRQVQFLRLKAEPVLRAEPQAQAESEAPGHVPAVPGDGQAGGQVDVRQKVRAVQPPVTDASDLQVPGQDPFRNDGLLQQLAQAAVGQPAVHLLQDPREITLPDTPVHGFRHGDAPGVKRGEGLLLPQTKLKFRRIPVFRDFSSRERGGEGFLRRGVRISHDRLFHFQKAPFNISQ